MFDHIFGDDAAEPMESAYRGRYYVRISGLGFTGFAGRTDGLFLDSDLMAFPQSFEGASLGYHYREGALTVLVGRSLGSEEVDRFPGQDSIGPYQLADAPVIPASESVRIETRDRFRPSLILDETYLERLSDYQIDNHAGRLTLALPLPASDARGNPKTLVVTYEVEGNGVGTRVTGLQASWSPSDRLTIGARAMKLAHGESRYGIAGAQGSLTLFGDARLTAEVALSDGESTEEGIRRSGPRKGRALDVAFASSLFANSRLSLFFRNSSRGFQSPQDGSIAPGADDRGATFETGLGPSSSLRFQLEKTRSLLLMSDPNSPAASQETLALSAGWSHAPPAGRGLDVSLARLLLDGSYDILSRQVADLLTIRSEGDRSSLTAQLQRTSGDRPSQSIALESVFRLRDDERWRFQASAARADTREGYEQRHRAVAGWERDRGDATLSASITAGLTKPTGHQPSDTSVTLSSGYRSDMLRPTYLWAEGEVARTGRSGSVTWDKRLLLKMRQRLAKALTAYGDFRIDRSGGVAFGGEEGRSVASFATLAFRPTSDRAGAFLGIDLDQTLSAASRNMSLTTSLEGFCHIGRSELAGRLARRQGSFQSEISAQSNLDLAVVDATIPVSGHRFGMTATAEARLEGADREPSGRLFVTLPVPRVNGLAIDLGYNFSSYDPLVPGESEPVRRGAFLNLRFSGERRFRTGLRPIGEPRKVARFMVGLNGPAILGKKIDVTVLAVDSLGIPVEEFRGKIVVEEITTRRRWRLRFRRKDRGQVQTSVVFDRVPSPAVAYFRAVDPRHPRIESDVATTRIYGSPEEAATASETYPALPKRPKDPIPIIEKPERLAEFQIEAPPLALANRPIDIVVTASSDRGRPYADYRGTIRILTSEGKEATPFTYTFRAEDSGVARIRLEVPSAGSIYLIFQDTRSPLKVGTSGRIEVTEAIPGPEEQAP